jgi:heme/copper-type cytochrome/quinol oxidase subunit 2
MPTRLILAYALIVLLVIGLVILIVRGVRKRRRRRRDGKPFLIAARRSNADERQHRSNDNPSYTKV